MSAAGRKLSDRSRAGSKMSHGVKVECVFETGTVTVYSRTKIQN